MAEHASGPGIMGQHPTELRPFESSDLVTSFASGALWGGLALGALGVGAWLIGVARQRINFSNSAPRESASNAINAEEATHSHHATL